MLEALALTVALAVPSDTDREWAANRPTRGAYSRVVITAATPPVRYTSFASCVLHRESGGDFERRSSGQGALNGEGSGAAGRWQFMPDWRHGLPYMIKDRLEQFGMPHKQARQVRIYLSGLHYIHKYPGLYQDIGAFEVMERGGAYHWDGPGC